MQLPESLFSVVVGAILGAAAFFSKRTLSNYDRRIRDMELFQKSTFELLNKIDKEIVRINTTLDHLNR